MVIDGMRALTLLEALTARLTVQARICKPLDAHAVTKLDRGTLSVCADGDDTADTL